MPRDTPAKHLRLKPEYVQWLEREAKRQRRSETAVVEELMDRAMADSVAMTPQITGWIVAEARRRSMSHAALLEELIAGYQPDPSAYYLHAAALQSWITARLQTIILMDNPDIDFQKTYDLVSQEARAVFGPDPQPGGRRPSTPTTPRTLRQLFSNVPDFEPTDRS